MYIDKFVKNTFHIAAKYSIVEILLKANKTELNSRDDNGRTPIHYAALKGNLNALKIILTMGGRVDKCDFYGYSVLHYSVKSRNTACVLFLINYEPKLIWMMDINNNTAKHLAQTLDYTEIVSLIDKFLESQSYLILRRLYRFQIKEMKNAERRRAKYACLMKSADKHHENEYNQRQGDRILLNNQFLEKGICSDGGSRYSYYSGSEERENKMKNYNSKISNKIVLNENVTLLTLNNNSTNV